MPGRGSCTLQSTGWSLSLGVPIPYLVSFHMQHTCCKSFFFCGIQLFSALSIPSASLSTMDSKWEKGRIWVSLHSFSAEHFQPYSCMMRLLEPQRTYLLSAQGSISISAESLKIIKINGNRIYMCANYFFKEPKTAQHLPLPYILFIT